MRKNKHGLYDAAVHKAFEEISLNEEELNARLDQGAFMLSYEEAIAKGFLLENEPVIPASLETSVRVSIE